MHLVKSIFSAIRRISPTCRWLTFVPFFGIAASTGVNKAKVVRDALGIRQFDHRWTLPSRLGSRSAVWMVDFNGLLVDARWLPVEIQEAAVLKGLIPYVVPPANN